MWVKATKTGYHECRRYKGDVFSIKEDAFSDSWMEKIGDDPVPDEPAAQEKSDDGEPEAKTEEKPAPKKRGRKPQRVANKPADKA